MMQNSLIERRKRLLGANTHLFYEKPVHIVRGEGVWLYDDDGKRYLDCYNNVPSVGHCHPQVVDALCEQARTLNVHTRYLHENILTYAEQLLAKFDDSLNRVMFVCTGSEANDQALRIARTHTGKRGIICSNATYHGNTETVVKLSTIFGSGSDVDEDIRMVDWPDSYRTKNGLAGDALYKAYAEQVSAAITSLQESGIGLAGMIVCPIFANEGLPVDPHLYLQKVIPLVREAGGLYIADEVQAGFGRTGKWWGHTDSGLTPDIVTLGKPMGAGHPLAGLIAKGDLIDEFQENEGYFNTFGGNPVSCAVGLAVLNVLEGERLIENSAEVGTYALQKFTELKERHEVIGDVRGNGLFFGMDLVSDRTTKTPDASLAKRVVNEMRNKGILLGNIGEHGNILKLRPPLCFSTENTDLLFETLDEVFNAG
jgi:4-aminobutyrate aminotransferase-like enzyme